MLPAIDPSLIALLDEAGDRILRRSDVYTSAMSSRASRYNTIDCVRWVLLQVYSNKSVSYDLYS
jgi:hypothetical protein